MATDRRDAVFGRVPYPVKVLGAATQGARLRHRRYGRRAEARVAAALQRDRWSGDRWTAWQGERHRAVLAHAVAQVPFYRDWFASHPSLDPADALAWPVVAKSDLQQSPERFAADDAPRRRVEDHTSGTSGTPLTVVASIEGLRTWFALHEARTRRWHGVRRHDRWAILGGRMVARPDRDRPPYWVWNPSLHQLYLAANLVSPRTAPAFVDALARFRPTHIVAYPSALAHLARLGLDAGRSGAGPQVVIANAEPLLEGQRAVIEQFFQCPVRETYGMAEMVAGASECEDGTMHLWPDAGMLEILDDAGRPVCAGQAGRLVATGLVNDAVPLIRYDVGDRGTAPDRVLCACGRSLPRMPAVEGRAQDMVRTLTGAEVFWLNPVLNDLPVVQAQFVQESASRLKVLVVAGAGFGPGAAQSIRDRTAARVGAMEVVVETTDHIPCGPNGKFRPIISLV